MKILSSKWRVVRSRDRWVGGYGRYWTVTSPWRLTDACKEADQIEAEEQV